MRRIVACILAAGLAAGCGKSSDSKQVTVQDKNGKVTISANGQQFSMKSEDNKSSVEVNTNGMTGDLKLPSFVAVFPGAKVISTVHGADTNNSGGMVAFETTSSPSDVIAFYKQKSAAAGFQERMSMNQQGTMIFMASSADNKQTMQVSASPGGSGSGSRAQVTWSGS